MDYFSLEMKREATLGTSTELILWSKTRFHS
jgi:hypothetical protein